MSDTHEILSVLRRPREDGVSVPAAAVAKAADALLFVPGELPCGECGACRRALVSACSRVRVLPARLEPGDALPEDVPLRFTYRFEPSTLLPADQAVWAALVAPLLEGMARAGHGAGDVSLWLGTDPQTLLGACLAAGRGGKVLVAGPSHLRGLLETLPAASDSPRPRFAPWHALDGDALAQLTESPDGLPEAQLYVTSDDVMAWTAAAQLLRGGVTLVSFGPMPALAGLPGDSRVFTTGERYNPDFLPEALAALMQNPDLRAVCELLRVGGAFEVVSATARD